MLGGGRGGGLTHAGCQISRILGYPPTRVKVGVRPLCKIPQNLVLLGASPKPQNGTGRGRGTGGLVCYV